LTPDDARRPGGDRGLPRRIARRGLAGRAKLDERERDELMSERNGTMPTEPAPVDQEPTNQQAATPAPAVSQKTASAKPAGEVLLEARQLFAGYNGIPVVHE